MVQEFISIVYNCRNSAVSSMWITGGNPNLSCTLAPTCAHWHQNVHISTQMCSLAPTCARKCATPMCRAFILFTSTCTYSLSSRFKVTLKACQVWFHKVPSHLHFKDDCRHTLKWHFFFRIVDKKGLHLPSWITHCIYPQWPTFTVYCHIYMGRCKADLFYIFDCKNNACILKYLVFGYDKM